MSDDARHLFVVLLLVTAYTAFYIAVMSWNDKEIKEAWRAENVQLGD